MHHRRLAHCLMEDTSKLALREAGLVGKCFERNRRLHGLLHDLQDLLQIGAAIAIQTACGRIS